MLSILASPAIIPRPLDYSPKPGAFRLSWNTTIIASAEALDEARFLARSLRPATGFPLPVRGGNAEAPNSIALLLDTSPEVVALGREGYVLAVAPDRIVARATAPAGLFYAVQTLRQMLPHQSLLPTKQTHDWLIPCARIADKPRFAWRGMHLDVSRHFFPPEFIKRFIDLIAFHKFNVFHWHLIDDGGWRMESLRYPLLTERGAWRSAPKRGEWSQAALNFPETRSGGEYGGYYTRAQIREIVAYAAQRHVTVVPEIELPGHTLPSIVCYPNLACDPPGENQNVYCAGSEETFEFLENVLDETLDLFPSEFIHIGGDEVYKGWWSNCSRCKRRMDEERLQNVDELQSYFIRRIDALLTARGRKLIGWDEILEGGLARNATVMSWRGIEGGIEAVRQGRDAVMCPTSHCYFDYSYGTTPTEEVYLFDPVPPDFTSSEATRILGAQGNLWTEWMPDEERVLYMAFPRATALAEALWLPQEQKNLQEFLERLDLHYARLDALGVTYRIPAPQPATAPLVFDSEATVKFQPPPHGMLIRYTTDGSAPTAASTPYERPFRIHAGTVVRAATFRNGGSHSSDETRIACLLPDAHAATGLVPGVAYRLYHGSWSRVPDFDTLVPVETGATDRVGTHVKQREEQYGIRFSGYLDVPADGEYEFYLGSDDGSVLRIAGATVVDNDGLHGFVERSASVYMKRGVYPFVLDYFEQGGADSVSLRIEGDAEVLVLREG
ncbi:MAG: family 20 glycosylhydrolase [Armatimonadota bacterium]